MEGIVGMIKLSLQASGTDQWRLCDGTLLAKADFPELYTMIGNKFGGDESHFALPDLRGEQAHYLIKAKPRPEDAHFVGLVSQMVLWVGEDLPANWFPCDGRPIIGADYPALHKLVAQGMPSAPAEFRLPVAESIPGVRYIMCMEGKDPTQQEASGPKLVQDDDDY